MRYVGEPVAAVFTADPYTAEYIADLVAPEIAGRQLRQARCPKLFAPLGSRCIAIADRPADRLGEDARTRASAQPITVIDGKTLW